MERCQKRDGQSLQGTCPGCLGHHEEASHLQSGTAGVLHGSVLGMAAKNLESITPRQAGWPWAASGSGVCWGTARHRMASWLKQLGLHGASP